MATTYNAKLDVSCIKKHECLGCQAEYQYHLERNVTGSGGSQAAAEANAQKAAIKALENDVDQHACPHCGLMQPDMIAEVRSGRFVGGMWVAPIFLLLAFFLALPHVITISTSAIIAVVGVVISLLLFVSGIFFNPNKDMSMAQVESSDKVQNGVIEMTKPGNTSTSVDDFSGAGGGHWFGLMFGAAALVAVLAPLVLPVVSGWTKNDTYPAVVGAGDTTCVYFDQKIKSLKGMWHGSTQVTAKSNPELSFRGKTKNSTWGNTISGKSVSNENHAMWVEVTMPESTDVVGKTIDLDFVVNATYPLEMNGGFDDMRDSFNHSESITMSAAGAGGTRRF